MACMFKNLDLFGQYFILEAEESRKFKTNLGALFSLLLLFIVSLLLVISGEEFLSRNKPTVSNSNTYLDDSVIKFSELKIKFKFFNSKTNEIITKYQEYLTFFNFYYNNAEKELRYNILKFKKCDNEDKESSFSSINSDLFCLSYNDNDEEDEKDYSLKNTMFAGDSSLIGLGFSICDAKESICAKNIEEVVNYLSLVIYIEDNIINAYDYASSVKSLTRKYIKYFKSDSNNGFYRTDSIYFTKDTLETDRGWLLEKTESISSIRIKDYKSELTLNNFSNEISANKSYKENNNKRLLVYIGGDSTSVIIKRKYLKIQDVLASFGGLINSLYLIIYIILYYFNRFYYLLSIKKIASNFLGEDFFTVDDAASIFDKKLLKSNSNIVFTINKNKNSGKSLGKPKIVSSPKKVIINRSRTKVYSNNVKLINNRSNINSSNMLSLYNNKFINSIDDDINKNDNIENIDNDFNAYTHINDVNKEYIYSNYKNKNNSNNDDYEELNDNRRNRNNVNFNVINVINNMQENNDLRNSPIPDINITNNKNNIDALNSLDNNNTINTMSNFLQNNISNSKGALKNINNINSISKIQNSNNSDHSNNLIISCSLFNSNSCNDVNKTLNKKNINSNNKKRRKIYNKKSNLTCPELKTNNSNVKSDFTIQESDEDSDIYNKVISKNSNIVYNKKKIRNSSLNANYNSSCSSYDIDQISTNKQNNINSIITKNPINKVNNQININEDEEDDIGIVGKIHPSNIDNDSKNNTNLMETFHKNENENDNNKVVISKSKLNIKHSSNKDNFSVNNDSISSSNNNENKIVLEINNLYNVISNIKSRVNKLEVFSNVNFITPSKRKRSTYRSENLFNEEDLIRETYIDYIISFICCNTNKQIMYNRIIKKSRLILNIDNFFKCYTNRSLMIKA